MFEINRYLKDLADRHPDKVTLSDIGKTPQGRDIPVLYFGTPNEKKKIRVWIQAGLHGNEPAGPEAACMLADYLLNTPEGAELLKKVSLALVPVANTDGYAMHSYLLESLYVRQHIIFYIHLICASSLFSYFQATRNYQSYSRRLPDKKLPTPVNR